MVYITILFAKSINVQQMSLIKQSHDHFIRLKQKSIDLLKQDYDHEMPYCLNKFNKSKNRNNTKSLQSIDIHRPAINIPQRYRQQSQRRQLFSIDRIQSKQLLTQRPFQKQDCKNNIKEKAESLHLRYRNEHMYTIEEHSISHKQTKIKNCIKLMQGVLEEIQNQKSHRRIFKIKKTPDLPNQINVLQNQKPPQSKFQSYIKNICKLRQQNKIMIVKRAKAQSNTIDQNVRSAMVLNADKFRTIIKQAQTIKQCKPSQTANKDGKQTKYFAISVESPKKLEDIECSMIGKVNQSSFISDFGKKSLMKQLGQDIEEENLGKNKQTIDHNKKASKMKKLKKLKSLFPDDFF